jgi:acetylornithine deacetylase/succinyl-diaminopimelate desuccinylase
MSEEQKKDVLQHIEDNEVVMLTRELVSIPSHYKVEGGESDLAEHIQRRLTREGIEATTQSVFDGRSNVYASMKGNEEQGKSLLFCGHIDTVLPGGMDHEPFAADMKNGLLWGRGSVDMKGGNAAMLLAMMAVKRSGIELKGSLHYAGVVGEESPNNSEGAKHLVSRGLIYDYAVVGEATALKVAGFHKGMSWLKVRVKGKACHASKPKNGINAVSIASRMIVALEDVLVPKLAERNHPYVSAPTLSIGRIQGGLQNNTVPDECWFSMDRRLIPGESIEGATQEIRETIGQIAEAYPGASFSIEEEPETEGRSTLESGVDNELVDALAMEIEAITGEKAQVGGVDYWTDGAHLARMGTKTVIFGPGDIAQAHAATEFVAVDQLVASAKIYARLAVNLLS